MTPRPVARPTSALVALGAAVFAIAGCGGGGERPEGTGASGSTPGTTDPAAPTDPMAGKSKGDRVGTVGWTLQSIADDARSAEIRFEAKHCATRTGTPQVREDDRSVTIDIPEILENPSPDLVCTADFRSKTERVRFAAPLGDRTLRDTSGIDLEHPEATPAGPAPRDVLPPQTLGADCARLADLPADAPVRQTLAMRDRIAACERQGR